MVNILNKKTIYIIVAVLIVVIVVGVAGVMLLNNGGNGGQTTPTPTPAPTIATATSVQFTVQDATGNYTYYAKDADGISTDVTEADLQLRLEILGSPKIAYVIDCIADKAASDVTGTMAAEDFQTNYDMWIPVFQGYVSKLAAWSGTGDYTYTEGTATITITGITINPTLADSLFATP